MTLPRIRRLGKLGRALTEVERAVDTRMAIVLGADGLAIRMERSEMYRTAGLEADVEVVVVECTGPRGLGKRVV